MRWAYPGAFVAMGIEGALTGPAPPNILMAGLALFGLAKALKIWAISSLGSRWSYRVLVVPGEPLVTAGPYRFISHPNYLAVAGEIVGVALIVWAPITGTLAAIGFGWLMIVRMPSRRPRARPRRQVDARLSRAAVAAKREADETAQVGDGARRPRRRDGPRRASRSRSAAASASGCSTAGCR